MQSAHNTINFSNFEQSELEKEFLYQFSKLEYHLDQAEQEQRELMHEVQEAKRALAEVIRLGGLYYDARI